MAKTRRSSRRGRARTRKQIRGGGKRTNLLKRRNELMETLKVGMEKLNAAKRELNAELDGEEPTERQQKLYKNMENMKAKYNTTKAKVEALRASALDRPL